MIEAEVAARLEEGMLRIEQEAPAPAANPNPKTEKKMPKASASPPPEAPSGRPCGCAATGRHKRGCELAPPAVAQKCDGCGRKFKSIDALNGHKRSCKGKPKTKPAPRPRRAQPRPSHAVAEAIPVAVPMRIPRGPVLRKDGYEIELATVEDVAQLLRLLGSGT